MKNIAVVFLKCSQLFTEQTFAVLLKQPVVVYVSTWAPCSSLSRALPMNTKAVF